MRLIYKAEFIGKLKIEELNPGYKASFYLNHSENPFVLMYDGDDFLGYVKDELRKNKLIKTEYFGATKLPYYERTGTNRQDRRNHCGTCI